MMIQEGLYIKIELLWKDRKRFLGMPLSFTRYSLSEDRLFLSVGCFSIKDDEVLLYRVKDISVSRSFRQRIFGVGTITIASADKTTPILVLQNVKKPIYVKELLHAQVEEMKIRHRMRFGEMMTTDFDDDDGPDDTP